MGGTRQDTYQRRSKALVVPPCPTLLCTIAPYGISRLRSFCYVYETSMYEEGTRKDSFTMSVPLESAC